MLPRPSQEAQSSDFPSLGRNHGDFLEGIGRDEAPREKPHRLFGRDGWKGADEVSAFMASLFPPSPSPSRDPMSLHSFLQHGPIGATQGNHGGADPTSYGPPSPPRQGAHAAPQAEPAPACGGPARGHGPHPRDASKARMQILLSIPQGFLHSNRIWARNMSVLLHLEMSFN